MTLKEAKKILKKEGFIVDKIGKSRTVCDFFIENEAPDICEAMQVVSTAGYDIYMEANRFDARKARLKKEHEENTKASGSDGDQSKEKVRIICCSSSPKADFYYKHVLKEGNPALAESASQFNDSLLEEQAKKIAELTEEKERLEDKITIFNIFKKRNDEAYRRQIRSLDKEISKLNGIIHDKNAVLSDVAEELRLSKIREKNLTEVSQKYMKENEELKKKLANKIVDKIDAQTLKSAESALAYKEKVIAEKDEVIADLDKELKENHKKYVWYKGLYEAAKQILNTIADYAAKHPDKKFSDQMVQDAHVECGTKVLVDKSFLGHIMKKAYGK